MTPDLNKIIVFKSGISKGLILSTDKGGHKFPISMLGLNLLWKNPQKKLKKNKISETIKKIIPKRILLITKLEWNPESLLSRLTSRHQKKITKNIINKNHINIFFKSSIQKPKKALQVNKPRYKGQGLTITIWNLWVCFIYFSAKYIVIKVINT